MICGTPFLAIIGGIFLISILLSEVRCQLEQPCQDCSDQKHIKVIINIPGKCDVCWPCELLECQEGLGSSVACGSTVSHGTTIDCVACITGVNFSDTLDSKQCQPCGTCAGSHEHVFANCSPKHNVKCECNDGFYRNRTTGECLPCVLCCTNGGKIAQRCRGDGGEIEKKCQFNKLWPKTCLPLSSSINPNVSKATETYSSAVNYVVVTSSSLMRSSVLNQTDTPLLHSTTTIAPVVSKTVQKEVLLSSVWPGHGISSSILRVNIVSTSAVDSTLIKEKKRDITLKVHSHMVVSISIFLSLGLVFLLALGCTLKKHWRLSKSMSVNQHHTEKNDSKPDTGGKTHKRKSKVSGGVSHSALQIIDECNILENVDATCGTPDASRNCSSCAHKKETGPAHVQIVKASQQFFPFNPLHQIGSDLHHHRFDKKWRTLSDAEKYRIKMQEIPFLLYHKVCLDLDIKRGDGKDVREFANELNISVREHARLQQEAKIQNRTTTSVILDQKPFITVGEFADIMKEMERQDIVDLITGNEW